VADRQPDVPLLGRQRDAVEPLQVRRLPDDREVDLARLERGHLPAPVVAPGLDGHAGMGLGEGGADAGDELAGAAGLEAEPQAALLPLAVATRGLRQPVAGAQHPLGLAQRPAGVRGRARRHDLLRSRAELGASPERSRAIFEAFAQAGGTYIDTASIYGDGMDGEQGASERVLADLLAADREHFVVATKYTSYNGRDVSRSGNSAKTMRESVDASLRADHLDLLWLHTWDGTTPVEEVLRAAGQLANAGKILYFGLSDTPAWVVSQAVAIAEAHGHIPPIAVQAEYGLAERTPERELLPMAETLDLGVAAWGPLAAGLLTGKYTRRPTASRSPAPSTGSPTSWAVCPSTWRWPGCASGRAWSSRSWARATAHSWRRTSPAWTWRWTSGSSRRSTPPAGRRSGSPRPSWQATRCGATAPPGTSTGSSTTTPTTTPSSRADRCRRPSCRSGTAGQEPSSTGWMRSATSPWASRCTPHPWCPPRSSPQLRHAVVARSSASISAAVNEKATASALLAACLPFLAPGIGRTPSCSMSHRSATCPGVLE
jgi:diketogulonate reductase-like aldo/keto reductase